MLIAISKSDMLDDEAEKEAISAEMPAEVAFLYLFM